MSVLWPSKYAKIRFSRPGLCPGLRWGSPRRSPKPLSRLERGHLSPYPSPLSTDPPSALAMRPPRSPPDLCLWRLDILQKYFSLQDLSRLSSPVFGRHSAKQARFLHVHYAEFLLQNTSRKTTILTDVSRRRINLSTGVLT